MTKGTVLICPVCKEKNSLTPYMGGQFGTSICKACGYIGAIILEEEKEEQNEGDENL